MRQSVCLTRALPVRWSPSRRRGRTRAGADAEQVELALDVVAAVAGA